MTDKAIGSILVVCGCLFILVAIGLFMYNEREEKLAAAAAEEIIPKLEEVIYENAADENIELESEISGEPKDEIIIDGKTYIGLLSVPSLGLVLPVQREWSLSCPKDISLPLCRFCRRGRLCNCRT
ncbi:MAG: hypothetical protein LUD77_09295 [Clostridiales bacterium]|nr:hypothetical protein [Clostridiales bacterium]